MITSAIGLRGLRDYIRFVSRVQRGAGLFFALDIFLFAVFVFSLVRSIATATLLTGTYLGAWFAYAVYRLRNTVRRYLYRNRVELRHVTHIRTERGTVPLDQIMPSEREESLGYRILDLGRNEVIISSDEVDLSLRNDRKIILDRIHSRLVSENIRDHKDICLPILTRQFGDTWRRKYFFDEQKLGLSSEIDPGVETVHCHRGGYFDSFVTNEAASIVLCSPETGRTIVDGGSMFPLYYNGFGAPHLMELSESPANNHIGVSTLAFSADNYFCVWEQSTKSAVGFGQLVATGSGSCDYSDLVESSLRQTLQKAMQRELREESSAYGIDLLDSHIIDTEPLGFFRWLRRGGKPEFVGITRLAVDHRFLNPNRIEVHRPVGQRQSTFFVPTLSRLEPELRKLEEVARRGPGLSAPLAYLIHVLRRALERRPDDLEAFLFSRER